MTLTAQPRAQATLEALATSALRSKPTAMPAFEQKRPIGPKRRSVSSISATTSGSLPTSQRSAAPPTPFATASAAARSMSATATVLAPSRWNRSASARPMPPAPPVTTTTSPAAFTSVALSRLGPALREGERAGAERPALSLSRPGLARGASAVAREPRAQRGHEHGADAIGPVGRRVGLRVDQQRIPHPVPSERDILALRGHALTPEVPIVARLGKAGVGHGDRRVLELRVEHALHRRLQPARHRNVVRIDAPAVLGGFALEIEHVTGAGRREDDAPEARVRLVGVAVAFAEADERVLAREDHSIRIRNAHDSLPFVERQAPTLSQATLEAQIDGGAAVVPEIAALRRVERAEPDELGIAPEHPDGEDVALAHEGRAAEDHARARRLVAIERKARIRHAERHAVLHGDRVFARMDVLEHIGIGDAPDAGETRGLADLGKSSLELGETRDGGERFVERMGREKADLLGNLGDPTAAGRILRTGQHVEHTARTCDRWCAQWRLEAEGGGRRRRGPAGQRCAGFQNEPLDPPVLEVRSAPFMRHGPAQPDLVATLEPVAIAVGRRVVPKVLEVLHGRDAAAAHLDVLEPGLQLAEYRRQHQLEKRPDLQVPGEIEIADIHEALARLHDVIEFLARHYQKVLPSAHSYLAGRLRSNARFSRGAL